MTLTELVDAIDERLNEAQSAMTFDESTLRKKLREYQQAGIIRIEKEGRTVHYSRAQSEAWSQLADAVDLFSEIAPCGVVGSFLQDRLRGHDSAFTFKHHYITQAMDSEILAALFEAMREKRFVTLENLSRRVKVVRMIRVIPLRIYISAQNGRQYLIALNAKVNRINAYRLDYVLSVTAEESCGDYDAVQQRFRQAEQHMWGVNCPVNLDRLEHVEFDVRAGEDEEFIIGRLEREKRCGTVTQVDGHTWRYTADVYDTKEMLPWIRTFISRITHIRLSNEAVQARFEADLAEMYRMYGVEGGVAE